MAIAKIDFRITLRWINSNDMRASENTTQFPPLPKGEGRGEGEGDVMPNCASYREIYFGNHSDMIAFSAESRILLRKPSE